MNIELVILTLAQKDPPENRLRFLSIKLSISDTAKLTNVSARTVIRVAQKLASERSVAVI